MPELVPRGPDIPVDLLNQLDDERVVFFCGAGVSMGDNSELPGFHRLLCHVYQSNHIKPDAIEAEALQESQYDKAFELLERSERLGSQLLYESVVARLSVSPAGPLKLHRDLLALSRVEGGHRLVTTNFDNRFREAVAELTGHAERLQTHDAPALPVPNRHRWRTLVHLHGRIQPEGDRSDLILTSADFGRAYLTERWAARFVTALFREFTVVFVGYSLSDPVMKYLVDAVAAERAKGGNLGKAYAFVGCGPDKSAKVSADWTARNVEPILYDHRDDHILLRDTFRKWVDVRSDPQTRTRIALNGVDSLPERGDPEVARVTWALERSDVAQALAQAPPITGEQDFPKIERWLDVFAEAGLLSRAAVGPGTTDGAVNLVDDGSRSQSPLRLGEVSYQLARWIARHVHVPLVFGWVVRQGGRVHPELRREILRSLARPPKPIPPKLRLFWTVLFGEHAPDPWRLVFLEEQYEEADGAEKRRLEEALLRCLTPRLVLRPGSSNIAVVRRLIDRDGTPIPPIEACGHLRVRLGHDDGFAAAETVLSDDGFLCRHAERITAHLADALVLLREDAMVPTDSVTGRVRLSQDHAWIAADSDPLDPYDDWTHLIDLARKSYFVLAGTDPERASALLRRWAASHESLFRRLALHALAEDDKSEVGIVDALLLRGSELGLWNPELRNELLRFLNLAGSRLPNGLREGIVDAIHAGPAVGRSGQGESRPEAVHRAKARLLLELYLSGAALDAESRSLVKEVAGGRAAEDFDDVYEVFSTKKRFAVVHEEHTWAQQLLDGPASDLEQAVCDEAKPLGWDDADALVRVDAQKVFEALRACAERGRFSPEPWKHLLWHLAAIRPEGDPDPDVEDSVIRILLDAPDDFFLGVGTAAATFVGDLAEAWDKERESSIRSLWERAWLGTSDPTEIDIDDPVTQALNHVAGILAGAALARLGKHTLRPRSGLSSSLRPYFDAVAKCQDGHLGRVRLTASLNRLFTIDPEWTEEALVQRLDPDVDSSEALDMWAGFAWSPTVGPTLLTTLKPALLAVLARNDVRPKTMRALITLLVAICLDAPESVTESEVRNVMDSLSEESLCEALRSLGSRLTGSSFDCGQIWRDRIGPWLETYWPREGERNTARTSETMLFLVIASGDAFCHAVTWSGTILKPIETHAPLSHLKHSEHVKRQPSAVLRILDSVVKEDPPQYARSPLRAILGAIQQDQPGLTDDPRFRRLYRIADGQ